METVRWLTDQNTIRHLAVKTTQSYKKVLLAKNIKLTITALVQIFLQLGQDIREHFILTDIHLKFK